VSAPASGRDPSDADTPAFRASVARDGYHASPSRWPAPGLVTDADDERLLRLRRRVVEPVVTAMFTPAEIKRCSVHWGIDGREGDVWVRLDVTGERYESWLPSPWWQPEPEEMDPLDSEAEIAAFLADRLEDWVCETATFWGQQRRAAYQLPQD